MLSHFLRPLSRELNWRFRLRTSPSTALWSAIRLPARSLKSLCHLDRRMSSTSAGVQGGGAGTSCTHRLCLS